MARLLAAVGVLITTLAAALGALFTVAPDLKPCFGESSADFTGAPVFPGVRFHDHLVRSGGRREDLASEPNPLGAEIRFSYRTSGLRNWKLNITWSLVEIERDGTLGAVVPGQDRAIATIVTPTTCSESGGQDLFLPTPDRHKRYRAILELYRDSSLTDRLDLTETVIFRG
ncbi:hypothetical protein [Candidatus Solirubrobacter pratensis]|uniref:hypothetical protein n=1 Tax=Candidatus Solirubrobacter pratensis TaxID=1298857 RepID=UPI00041CF595|nr:hypothetical protein [Candidatus Solirubrobacter pratensis]